jgi:hypothetical protein
LGTEVRVAKPLLIRAGIQLKENPLIEVNSDQLNYSLGLGYRINKFYLDFAYILSTTSENYYLYDPVLIENSTINKNISKALITIGFRY